MKNPAIPAKIVETSLIRRMSDLPRFSPVPVLLNQEKNDPY